MQDAKCLRCKKQPLTAAGLHGLRDEYTRTIAPARARAAETQTLERTLSNLVNQAYALTRSEIDLMWQTAPPHIMPIPPPGNDREPKRRRASLAAARHTCGYGASERLRQ